MGRVNLRAAMGPRSRNLKLAGETEQGAFVRWPADKLHADGQATGAFRQRAFLFELYVSTTTPDFERPLAVRTPRLAPVRMDESAPRGKTNEQGRIVSFGLRGRLESERTSLIRPGHRQVDET
jgi:hypothetical protein